MEQGVKILRHGETVDLATLYETYFDLLSRTALTYMSHSEGAQNVAHDVSAVCPVRRPTFRDASHQRAWILCVVINKCRDLQCRNVIRRYTPLGDAECIAPSKDSEISELLAVARGLSDKLYEVMVLYYLERFSMEETARCLRISVSAVRMRLTHSRQAIKASLGTERRTCLTKRV